MGSLIEFGADSIRPVEILFKPYLIGEKKMGLIELIMEIVSLFDKEVRNTLLSNIRLTVRVKPAKCDRERAAGSQASASASRKK